MAPCSSEGVVVALRGTNRGVKKVVECPPKGKCPTNLEQFHSPPFIFDITRTTFGDKEPTPSGVLSTSQLNGI